MKHFKLSLLLAMTVIGCSKTDQLPSELGIGKENNRLSAAVGNSDVLRERTALKLAKALRKVELRSFLKTEVLKKFDDDYDVLFSKVLTYVNTHLNKDVDLTDLLDTENLPLLNVAIPVNIEKWDEKDYIPFVAFLPENFDEGLTKQIKAFDSEGNVHLLDTKEKPDFPVVVISFNERLQKQADGTYKVVKYMPTKGKDEIITQTIDKAKSGSARLRTVTPCTYPFRNYGEYLYLTGLSSDDISGYESWANGAPEIAFRVYAADGGSNYASLKQLRSIGEAGEWSPSDRNYLNNSGLWWSPPWQNNQYISIVNWTQALYGQSAMFYFYEVDGGTKDKTINLSDVYKTGKDNDPNNTVTLSISFTIGNHDEPIGPIIVDYLACPPFETTSLPGASGVPGYRFAYFHWYDVSPHFKMSLSPDNPYTIASGGW